MSKHRVIWPQERYMSDDDIRAYYADAVADKQVLPGMVNIEDMKYVLSDAGLFTFGSN